MIFSESNANISAALARAWSAIQTPKYNAKVKVSTQKGAYTFEYTDLNGILEAVRPIFIENKLFITQNAYSVLENNVTMACVETTFLHESGEYVKSYPLKFPAAQKMQDFGGQITYMKRYSLAAMLGIATEKDDDANGASGNSYQYQERQQSSPPKQQHSQQPPQPRQAQQSYQPPAQTTHRQPTDVIDGQLMNRLVNIMMPLAEIKNMKADVLYENSLKKLNFPYKKSKELTVKEAETLIGYLEAVTATVTAKRA